MFSEHETERSIVKLKVLIAEKMVEHVAQIEL